MQLLDRFVCHTTRLFSREISPKQENFQLLRQIRVSNIFLFFINNTFVRFAFTLSASQVHTVKKRSFQPSLCHPRIRIGIDLAHDAQIGIHSSVLSPILVPIEFFQIVFPTSNRQAGDHTNFASEEQPLLQCWTMIWATYAVVDVSNTWTFRLTKFQQFGSILPYDLGSAACPWHPGSHALTSISFAAVICDADEPALYTQHKSQNRFSQCHLGVQHVLCLFGISVPAQSF